MNWYQNLYTGKTVEKKKQRLIHEIEQEKYRGNIFLITLASNPKNQLEILSVHQLRFSYIRRTCPMIVGIASGRREALRLLESIVQEVYETTGDVKLREFFV